VVIIRMLEKGQKHQSWIDALIALF